MGTRALEAMFDGGMALLAEARARLADERVCVGLEEAGRGALGVLLLDLSATLLLLRAATEGDMPACRARDAAEQLDLPGQVARALTPALREARAPALQVVLLQVSGLAAQLLVGLDALAHPVSDEGCAPVELRVGAPMEKPRRRPAGRPRLHLVSSRDLPRDLPLDDLPDDLPLEDLSLDDMGWDVLTREDVP
ncbi:hypothetical protein V5F53_14740 [Xanthobacter sp. V4C-4]|uniref:hypothetical protein n=1 Tax=Xanthobacter cornucopiae TaxID=3119924 RepID=UPI0037296C59